MGEGLRSGIGRITRDAPAVGHSVVAGIVAYLEERGQVRVKEDGSAKITFVTKSPRQALLDSALPNPWRIGCGTCP